ncbi:hypothetical protein LCGC14_2625370, partial [marine sediment metagenome]
MIKLKDLLEADSIYNEPADKKKRLGGRYGGEPEKAITDPGNKEPALSAKKNEAVANAKDDVTPEDSQDIEKDLKKDVNFTTNSPKMFERMDTDDFLSSIERLINKQLVRRKID